MALTCQQNDDLLLNTPVSGRPEFNPLKTSYAFKYVKNGFIRANIVWKDKVTIARICKLMRTVARDFAPS